MEEQFLHVHKINQLPQEFASLVTRKLLENNQCLRKLEKSFSQIIPRLLPLSRSVQLPRLRGTRPIEAYLVLCMVVSYFRPQNSGVLQGSVIDTL